MLRSLRIATIVVLLVPFTIEAQTNRPQKGYLTLESNSIPGRIILDDSVTLDKLPKRMLLISGKHKVTVLNKNRLNVGQGDFIKTFEILPKRETKVTVKLDNMVEISTQPPGAFVFVDGNLKGRSPVWIDKEEVLNRPVKLDKAGYEIINTQISSFIHPYVEFDLIPEYSNKPGRSIIKLNLRYEKKTYRRELLLLTSLSVLSGGFAAYYKIKADKAFDKAKIALTQNAVSERRRYQNLADQYDRNSLIGFVSMQVNFIGVVYFLFKAD